MASVGGDIVDSRKNAVRKVIDYIEENLEKKLDLEQIAGDAGYSRFHLNRMFAKETGQTIYRYLRNRRLAAAAEKLIRTKEPIAQIALEAGYDSQQAFSLAFRKYYACPPGAYRERGALTPGQDKIRMRGSFSIKCGGYAA